VWGSWQEREEVLGRNQKKKYMEREEGAREGKNNCRKTLTLATVAAAGISLSCPKKMSAGREEALGIWQEGSKCQEVEKREEKNGRGLQKR